MSEIMQCQKLFNAVNADDNFNWIRLVYGKIYECTFTGSMYGGGAVLFAVWSYVLANTKPDNLIELNPDMLGAIIGVAPKAVSEAIETLCSPDPKSRTKREDGRRLLRKGEYIYLVVNAEKYRGLPNDRERRTYFAEKQREHRQRVKVCQTGMSNPVKPSQGVSNTHTQYSEAESRSKEEEIYLVYPRHDDKQEALKAIAKALNNGTTFEFLLERTRMYAATRQPRDRFTPLPATWFNKKRYEDDPSEWVREDCNQPKRPLDAGELKLEKLWKQAQELEKQ
jgi:hypothetical protein